MTSAGQKRYSKGAYQGKMTDSERAVYAKARVKAVGKTQAIKDEQDAYNRKLMRGKVLTVSLSALNVATALTGNPLAGAAFVANVSNVVYQNVKNLSDVSRANDNIYAIQNVKSRK